METIHWKVLSETLKNIPLQRSLKPFAITPGKAERNYFSGYLNGWVKIIVVIPVHQFYKQHNNPVELSTDEMLEQRLNYIHNNPVEAGTVMSPEHYLYSSAVNYAELPEKLIEVILIWLRQSGDCKHVGHKSRQRTNRA
jgi:hypothetical protein